MSRAIVRRLIAVVISSFHFLMMTSIATSSVALAQAVDSEPPVIEMEIVEEGVRGETQVFSATVSDNSEVTDVIFHFRYDGGAEYSAISMVLIPNTSVYTASIDAAAPSANAIEYYVEARDAGDNRTLQGFSFDPLERSLVSAESIAAAPSEGAVAPLSNNRKIIYGVLGLLVVGALVASSGGSSGGSQDGPGPLVPAEIIVEPFQ